MLSAAYSLGNIVRLYICLKIEIFSQVLCITAWIHFMSVSVRKAAFYEIRFWFGKTTNNAVVKI